MAEHDPTSTVPAWEPRVAVLERIAGDTLRALERIETRIDGWSPRFDQRIDLMDSRIDHRLVSIESELRDVRNRQDRDFKWIIALYLAGYGSMLAVMAHGFHWL